MAEIKTQNKGRPDSKIRALPQPVQDEVWERAKSQSLRDIATWLKESHAVIVSDACVSRYLQRERWYRQSQRLQLDQEVLMEVLKGQKHNVSLLRLDQYAEVLFKTAALASTDPITYMQVMTQRKRLELEEMKYFQREREINIMEKKLAMQVEQNEEAKRIAAQPMDDGEKMRRIKELFNIGRTAADE
jgi:hypothetical protein